MVIKSSNSFDCARALYLIRKLSRLQILTASFINNKIERFSKPNFGSIRRFRTLPGSRSKIESKNAAEPSESFGRPGAPNRIEFSIRFDLMPIAKPAYWYWSPALLCQVFDSFSPVTSLSWHNVSHFQGFIRSLTRPCNWAVDEFFFTSAGDFRQVHGHLQCMNGQEVLAMGSSVIEDLAEGVPRTCTVCQRTLLRYSAARHQSSTAGQAIVWSIVFLFAERNFRLCVDRNFETIFDPDLSEPNRIFGLLNLSNMYSFSHTFSLSQLGSSLI